MSKIAKSVSILKILGKLGLVKRCKREKFLLRFWPFAPKAMYTEYVVNDSVLDVLVCMVIFFATGALISCLVRFPEVSRGPGSYKILKRWPWLRGLVVLISWVILLYGFVNFSMFWINLWIAYNSVLLCFDLGLLMWKMFSGEERTVKSVLSYVWPIVFNFFVRLMYNAIAHALTQAGYM